MTFLAADKDNTDDAPEAFLSGVITDAQARYNLRNLYDEQKGKVDDAEVAAFKRLCDAAGVSASVADQLAALVAAHVGADDAPLLPRAVRQLGGPASTPRRCANLRSMSCCCRCRPVNLNTAAKEVIAAATGAELADAERLVQVRQQSPFKTLDEAKKHLPPALVL